MADPIWFGTRNNMRWVKAHGPVATGGKFGWSESTQLLSGKKHVRRSLVGHREYELDWSLAPREELQPIIDYADGLYGDGKIYWIDPSAVQNLFSTDWAAPFQGAHGGTVINGQESRPTLTPTTPNGQGYPVDSAVYTMVAGIRPKEFWIPIPPGYTLHLGVHGRNGTGGRVTYTPTTNGGVNTTPSNFTLLPVTGSQRTNVSISSSSADGVSISMAGLGTVILSAMTAVLLPTGETVDPGGFVSGRGHSGCVFEDQPQLELYNAAMGLVGVTGRLIEVI